MNEMKQLFKSTDSGTPIGTYQITKHKSKLMYHDNRGYYYFIASGARRYIRPPVDREVSQQLACRWTNGKPTRAKKKQHNRVTK